MFVLFNLTPKYSIPPAGRFIKLVDESVGVNFILEYEETPLFRWLSFEDYHFGD